MQTRNAQKSDRGNVNGEAGSLRRKSSESWLKEGSTAPAGSPRHKSSEIDNIKEGSTAPHFNSDLGDGDSDGDGDIDGDGDVDGKEGSIAPHFGDIDREEGSKTPPYESDGDDDGDDDGNGDGDGIWRSRRQ